LEERDLSNGAVMPRIELGLGEIEYEDTGDSGPPVVFLHGLAMNNSVWRKVIPRLQDHYRCLSPVLPVGGHRIPVPLDRDLSPQSVALMVGEFIEALDLRAPALVENDGGRAQTLAALRPELIGRLVLVACEAFDNYPPGFTGKLVGRAAKIPGGISAIVAPLRVRAFRRPPTAWGLMSKRPVPDAVIDDWIGPLLTDPRIRRDLRRYVLAVRPTELLEAAERLPQFERPVLVVWAKEDRMMPRSHGRRLASLFPDARLVEMEDCWTLIPEDQPEALASQVRTFLEHTPFRPLC
jgi:pimeloyl-ACP methyl ester carboxylesterase